MATNDRSDRLDSEIAIVLDSISHLPPMETMSLEELRAYLAPTPLAQRLPVGSTQDRKLADGNTIRIYRPTKRDHEELVIYFHGGGFVLGSLDTHDQTCRYLCESSRCAVISLDYRLAPENRYPAAIDDCMNALRWASEHIDELQASPRRIVLAGDSAGANLATVTAMRVRDQGGPALCGQVLAYPVTDYHTPPTPSYLANASGYSLTRKAMIRFWDDYLADDENSRHPYVSPMRSVSLANLPPALVMTAEFDPLRDEGDAYAAKLMKDGVPTTHIQYEGMIHGFLRMMSVSTRARAAYIEIAQWIHQLPDARQ